MGLDLLVLPLWRFFAGRYQGPVEQLATRVGSPKPDDPETLARERARRIREEVERRSGRPLIWSDEGETALSVQHHYAALQALRVFAANREYPDGLDKIYYQHAPTRYAHLIDHSDCRGFYFPVDFDVPVRCVEVVDGPSNDPPFWAGLLVGGVKLFAAWTLGLRKELAEERRQEKEEARRIKKLIRESPYPKPPPDILPKPPRGKSLFDWHKVGSSTRLLRELDELKGPLGVSSDAGELGPDERHAPEGDPLGDAKYGWAVLRHAARVSVEKKLPLILDG